MNGVLSYHNLSKDFAFAIGDSEGDIMAFEACKYSAAMGNGSENAKK